MSQDEAVAAAAAAGNENAEADDPGLLMAILSSPLNLMLLGLCCYLLYKIIRGDRSQPIQKKDDEDGPPLPKLKRRDFTLEELRPFDGVQNERILMAINGKVFDVSRARKFYGPDGPYGIFGGRDASRGLATFCLDREILKEGHDDLSDLDATQRENLSDWEQQFEFKYHYVGKLLKDGEEHTVYSDDEEGKAQEGGKPQEEGKAQEEEKPKDAQARKDD
ncbi:membrane-associated progesterone receptor component 1 [Podarcis muralis]